MTTAALTLALATVLQAGQAQPAPAPATPAPVAAPAAAVPELPVLDARLGGCSADFIVKNADPRRQA
jgi:hypothetical protein